MTEKRIATWAKDDVVQLVRETLSSDELDYLIGLARYNLHSECFIEHHLFKFWGVNSYDSIQVCIQDFQVPAISVMKIKLSDINRNPLPKDD